MKNKYFHEMQRRKVKFEKDNGYPEPTPVPENRAFKYWSIANHYNATDIIIDELPDQQNVLNEMMDVYRKAKVDTFVITDKAMEKQDMLINAGCSIGDKCRAFRRETQLYDGPLEVVKGIRITIDNVT